MTVEIPDFVYERIVKNLQQGIDVCLNVDGDSNETEKSPYYANGYSRGTMQSVIDELNIYKNLNN